MRPCFWHSGGQQGQVGDWEASAELVGGWEVIKVVSHVDLSESGASEVVELLVIAMQELVLGLHQVSHVSKLNSLLVDSYILQEVSQVAPSGLVDVSEHSILERNVILLLRVSVDLIINLVSEYILVSKKVLDLGFFDWHLFLISPVHSVLIVLEGVLDGKVLLLADFGQSLF